MNFDHKVSTIRTNYYLKKRLVIGTLYILLILLGISMLMPFIILISTSLKSYDEMLINPTVIFPKALTFEAFIIVFKENPFFLYLRNTLIITVFTIFGSVFTSAFVAYGFVRFKAPGSKLLFGLFISGMLIPGQILIIPMFELYNRMGWINSFLPFIIPPLFGGGIFNIFLQRQFMRGISREVFESAEIDGASEMTIFLRIALPMTRPVLITITIFTFLNSWNDLFGPLIYLDNPKLWTLAKGIYMIYQNAIGELGASGGTILPWNILSAANVLISIPIIILYFFAQKHFMEGVKISGSKES